MDCENSVIKLLFNKMLGTLSQKELSLCVHDQVQLLIRPVE